MSGKRRRCESVKEECEDRKTLKLEISCLEVEMKKAKEEIEMLEKNKAETELDLKNLKQRKQLFEDCLAASTLDDTKRERGEFFFTLPDEINTNPFKDVRMQHMVIQVDVTVARQYTNVQFAFVDYFGDANHVYIKKWTVVDPMTSDIFEPCNADNTVIKHAASCAETKHMYTKMLDEERTSFFTDALENYMWEKKAQVLWDLFDGDELSTADTSEGECKVRGKVDVNVYMTLPMRKEAKVEEVLA